MTATRIVFDLDGTLIDSAPDIHGAANEVLAAYGYPQITLTQSRGYVGHGAGIFIERMRAGLGIPDTEHEVLLAAFLELYEGAVHLTHPYPGVETALETFTTEGLPRPVSRRRHLTLPGASARRRFEVIAATTTVRSRLSLNSFVCSTRTGRR